MKIPSSLVPLSVVVACGMCGGKRTAKAAPAIPQLVPRPQHMTVGQSNFTLTRDTVLVAQDDAATKEAQQFAASLAPALGFVLPVKTRPGHKRAIVFALDPRAATGNEGYHLTVTPHRVTMTAAHPAGLFYATQTLRQLLPPAIYAANWQPGVTWTLPAVTIEDEPRFSWRGLMLDCGRHFFSVSEVEKFIDTLAVHKLNVFHWHLTEDQGWRLEIKRYPRLTEVGSLRAESPVMGAAYRGDGTPHGGFYTQQQAREVVAYAAARHVTVVPEIEMPGHASAAIAAYPSLGNTDVLDYDPQVVTRWGVHPYTFAPREETFAVLEDILSEVMAIFPSAYIHIGGDEAPKTQWEQSAFARDVMTQHNLKDARELQSYFIRRIAAFLNAHGRHLIGWDEILEGGLAPNAAVMSWRGSDGALAASQQNHPVVMASNSAYYFDYRQNRKPNEPFGGFLPLRRVYEFEPASYLPQEKRDLLLGAQGQVWTESIATYPQVEYMAYPRACALAETDWSPLQSRNYDDFRARLATHVARLKAMDVNFCPLEPEVTSAATWHSGQIGEAWGPQTWDVTSTLAKIAAGRSGTLTATFQYSGGAHRLDIAWVELLQNGQVIARDEHSGVTGGFTQNNVYRFALPTLTAGATYTLRAQVRADGGNDSNGDIFVAMGDG